MQRLDLGSRRKIFENRGFTLIEIISVLLILGVISYFVATRLFIDDVPTSRAGMELVKSHLRYAQSRTMNTEMDWGITFENASVYFLFRGDNPSVPVRLPGDESSNSKMTLSSVTVTSAPQTVRFLNADFGSPGSTSIIITTTAGNITVTKNTGFIP
jgi:prepilin-type N-terminal cleavage/methylation domain-containing protein